MEQSNKIKRSEAWNNIYEVLARLDLKETTGDALDRPSAATEIEALFLKLLGLQNVKPRFPKEQLHLKKGSRILNIRGRHIVDKPEILINCMEYWEPTDEDYGSAEEDDATYFPTANEIDEIIKALTEAKVFLNGA